MMSSPALSCALIAMMVASSWASARNGSDTRHSSRARTRGGKRPASFWRSISHSGWGELPTNVVGNSMLTSAGLGGHGAGRARPGRIAGELGPNGRTVLIQERSRAHRARTHTAELHRRAHRMRGLVWVLHRNDQSEVLYLRVFDDIVDAIDRRVRHVVLLQPLDPVSERLTREARIELEAQRRVLRDAIAARVAAWVAPPIRRFQL